MIKKIFAAMSAALMVVCAVRAEEKPLRNTETGFEQYGINVFDWRMSDLGNANGNYFWNCEDSGYGGVLTEYPEVSKTSDLTKIPKGISRPSQHATTQNTTFLKLDSVGRLSRTPEVTDHFTVTPVKMGETCYFDSIIQFSPCNTLPTITRGDKICVWLYGESAKVEETNDTSFGPSRTNLVITAGYLLDAGNTVEPRHYLIENVKIPGTNEWHRLTIKALGSLNGEEPDYKSGQTPAGFAVFVDGVPLTNSEEKGAAGSTIDRLNAVAAKWNAKGALFPSLQIGESTTPCITSVDFLGAGAVDDIVFTRMAPDFAADSPIFTATFEPHLKSFSIAVSGDRTYTAQAEDLAAGVWQIPIDTALYESEGATLTCSAVGAPGYAWSGVEAGSGTTWDGSTLKLEAGRLSPSAKFIVTEKGEENSIEVIRAGDSHYFDSFDEALASGLLDDEGAVTIKLWGDQTVNGLFGPTTRAANVKAAVTLDLNGLSLTATEGAVIDCAIDLTITDTSEGLGRIVGTDVMDPAISVDEMFGKLAIEQGEIAGQIQVSGDADLWLTGGRYASNNGEVFYLDRFVDPTCGGSYADGYWTLDDSGEWPKVTYLLEIPVVPLATMSVTTNGALCTVKQGEVVAVARNQEVEIVWTAVEGYKITAGGYEGFLMTADRKAKAPAIGQSDAPTMNGKELTQELMDEMRTGTALAFSDTVTVDNIRHELVCGSKRIKVKEYYDIVPVADKENTYELELNDAARPLIVAIDMEDVPPGEETDGFFIVTTRDSYPDLYYIIVGKQDLRDEWTIKSYDYEYKKGSSDGSGITLKAWRRGDQCFYAVRVLDVLPKINEAQ